MALRFWAQTFAPKAFPPTGDFMEKKDKVYLPQLIGLIVFVITQIIHRFLWEMPYYLYIGICVCALIAMIIGVGINYKRK